MPAPAAPSTPIDRLTFVYDADGTLAGELKYWFGTLLGADHCSLCDITHSRWGKRKDFGECARRLGLPITYRHRNDVDADLRASVPAFPVVIGHRGETTLVLLGPAELADLHGDVSAFEERLRAALAAAG
jgi:hypothetical protein